MRYRSLALLCVAMPVIATACSYPRPDSSTLAAAEDCQALQERSLEFVVEYAEYASTRPVHEVVSVEANDVESPIAAGLVRGLQQGRSRAIDLGCDLQALREQLQVAAAQGRDVVQSASSQLLIAQFANGPNIQALHRALTVIAESQDAHQQYLGVYASGVEELRSQVPDFEALVGEAVDVEIVSAGQESYCAVVRVADLPAVYLDAPEMVLLAESCE